MLSNPNQTLREKVQCLIDNGNTSDALLLMFEAGYYESITLKAQLDSASAQLENQVLGLIEWQVVLDRVNCTLLHLLDAKSALSDATFTMVALVPEAEKNCITPKPAPAVNVSRQKRGLWSKILKLIG